jgi:hypothetical protein
VDFGPGASDLLTNLCRELKHAPLLSALTLNFVSHQPHARGLPELLAGVRSLTELSLHSMARDGPAFTPVVRAIASNPADTLRRLSIVAGDMGHAPDLLIACDTLLRARPRLLHYLHLNAGGATDLLLPGLRAVSVPLLFVHLYRGHLTGIPTEMPHGNPLVRAVRRKALSDAPSDEKTAGWARAMWVGPAVNWQCIAITLSALRTRSSIALSVLPLLKGICAMAFEVPFELSKAIGPTDAVPTVSVHRFLYTRFAQSVTGVAFGAAPLSTSGHQRSARIRNLRLARRLHDFRRATFFAPLSST